VLPARAILLRMKLRVLQPDDIDDLIALYRSAFPGEDPSADERERLRLRLASRMDQPEVSMVGLHRDGRLACAMRVNRYRMTFGAVQVPLHGLGAVAVDLAHKKEKLGKMMVEEFLAMCAAEGAALAALYPFRADFYKRMGFGMGSKKSLYSLPPSAFPPPDGSPRVKLRRAGPADDRALCACYNRFAARRHGMFERSARDFEGLLGGEDRHAFVHEQEGRVTGYVVFTFRRVNPHNPLTNDIDVQEWLYEDARALRALCGFFAAQSDQVRRVVLPTQDPAFYHLFMDPRDDSDRVFFQALQTDVSGAGIMYRVVDPAALFGRLRFGQGRCRVRLTVRDPLLQPAEHRFSVGFADGRAAVDDQPADMELALGLADFSSWIVGAVSLRALCGYGLADLSAPERADELDRIVLPVEPPMCLTRF
jgi:predicted acetyltransferase